MSPAIVNRGRTLEVSPKPVLGEFGHNEGGPTLSAVCSIHGNEPRVSVVLGRVAKFLDMARPKVNGKPHLLGASLGTSFVGDRFIDSDLNRHWILGNILKNTPEQDRSAGSADDREQHKPLNILGAIWWTASDEVHVPNLDTTTTRARVPFATVDDTMLIWLSCRRSSEVSPFVSPRKNDYG